MNDIITLLKPRLLSARNSGLSKHKNGGILKFLFLGSIGAIFWAGIFAVSLRVLIYFREIKDVGDIVAFKFLSMMLITSFALLIFSSILTSLSKLYLSRDLNLVHSLPVPSYKIFLARWADSTIESSWMVIVYILPVLLAYGIAFNGGPFFYASVVMVLLPLSMIASSVSSILVMGAVIFIPANRMKTVFIFFGLVLFMVLYMAFRLLRPELLVDPEVFLTALVYMKNLQTPSSPFLPSTWAYDSIKNTLSGQTGEGLFHMALSWSCAGTFLFVITMIADFVYFKGFSKTQTASVRLFKQNNSKTGFLNFLPTPVRALTVKEIKTFLRDQTQWTQLFLIAGLIFIYTHNFKVLPLDKAPINTVYLQNLLSFLNMGLALFVLTAITARFGYPAVSAEKDAFWIVKSAPVSIKSFLWIKFFIYYFPLLILTEILIIVTNILLDVTPFMMVLSSISIFLMVPGIVSMGIGFGAAYPDFKAENPLQTVMSFGGILFMILCAGFIGLVIILEAGPVYKIFMAGIHEKALTGLDQAWTIISFSIAFIISILAIILPMKFGEKRLLKMFE